MERIEFQLEPFHAQYRLLVPIPGMDWVTAAAITAEIGTDMGVFATARHLAAWVRGAPGNYESAGKPKGAATRKGNLFLQSALFAAASAGLRAATTTTSTTVCAPVAAWYAPLWASPTSCASPRSTC